MNRFALAIPQQSIGVLAAVACVCAAVALPTTAQQSQPMSFAAETHPHAGPPRFTNLLAGESSPYLLQHAHNPVNWRPWGTEAFEAARAEDKPIFLSIGYSTCYWCHVMERECFENEAIAAIMNEHFICIKVDREERPDVDDIYMTATQLTTGSGGWPMSVWLEPNSLKPFLAGTYFPPEDRHGMPAFPRVLEHIANLWQTQREDVLEQADRIAQTVTAQLSERHEPVALSQSHVNLAIAQLMSSYDSRDGGFVGSPRRAPKFPTPVNLDFLIDAGWNDANVRRAVLHTLDRMAIGGMFDQVGGGFHRYSVDAQWLVPHFEKMLYDNGQLAVTYARAFELTGDDLYARTLRRTLDYVVREMTQPGGGGFFSAQDAEVNTREGGNYLWTADEVRRTLANAGLGDLTDFAIENYGLAQGTNFQDPHHPEDPPANVLFLIDKPQNIAQRNSISLEECNAQFDRINAALRAARNLRPQPATDDKVLAGWNGLMIAGFADGGRVLNESRYINAAAKAANFVLITMRSDDGSLIRTWRKGQARINAFLEDYAFMIRGLLALHRATNEQRWLNEATRLVAIAKSHFGDTAAGGYFDTRTSQSDLFVRVKSFYDGAVPSGGSVMLMSLIDLHQATRDSEYLHDALGTLRSMSSTIAQRPTGPIVATAALKRVIDLYPQQAETLGDVASPPPAPPPEDVVTITADRRELRLAPGESAAINLTLRIASGYHINAHDVGDDSLIPLRIELLNASGIEISVHYPTGEAFRGPLGDQAIHVHTGQVAVPIQLTRTGPIGNSTQLAITWQACTDRACLAPRTTVVELQIR